MRNQSHLLSIARGLADPSAPWYAHAMSRRTMFMAVVLGASLFAGTTHAESVAAAPEEASEPAPKKSDAPDDDSAWCHDSLDTLTPSICITPEKPGGYEDTLVIFLHGVIKPDTGWQHNQQRGFARLSAQYGFATIIPRGRRGLGPKTMEDWWTWPTSAAARDKFESQVLSEWASARATLEKRRGKPFDRLLVAGFSNGAYYASSLALRGTLPADGFAIFAGGSAPDYLKRAGSAQKTRPPIFVGYGTKDRTARDDAQELGRALKSLGWKYQIEARNVGHAIADAHFEHALAFLAPPKPPAAP